MSSHVVPGGAVAPEIHRRWERWRERRDAEFAKPHGWLSLTALHWLDEDPTAYDGLPGLWWADEAGIHHDPTPDTTTSNGTSVRAHKASNSKVALSSLIASKSRWVIRELKFA